MSRTSDAASAEPMCWHSSAAWQTKCFRMMQQVHFHRTRHTWLAERLQLMHTHAAAAPPVACWNLTGSPQKGAQGP